MQSTSTHVSIPIDRLADGLDGRVIGPSDADYDGARAVMAGGVDRRPGAIVRVASAADVTRVIRFAREVGAELAVRSGGHSGAAHGTTDGGIVIDVRDLRDTDLDVGGRTVWAGSGLTAGELTAEVTPHGLVVGFGDTGSVGLGGITTGGGVGYLVRRDGLTIDSLIGAEIVTADGEILEIDADHHPDLFWAIRGGGGNFGVITRFRYRLNELPAFYGGMLVLPATADTVAGFIAASEAAPEELSTIANVMTAPPMPFLPEEWVGRLVILGMIAYAGDADAGERAVAPFRALGEPLADMVKASPYAEMFPPEDPDYHPTAVAVNMHIDHVDRDVAATIIDHLERSDASLRAAQLRPLGGAMARIPADATAYAHRSCRIMVNLAAFYEGEADRPAKEAWVRDFAVAIDQGDPAVYVNFLGDEGPERVRAAYPGATWDRLVEVKRRYDPTNVFRLNQNITPDVSADR
jgi:FAD/FMN-containing dehydrogenase